MRTPRWRSGSARRICFKVSIDFGCRPSALPVDVLSALSSRTVVLMPKRTKLAASISPAGPAPTTTTSWPDPVSASRPSTVRAGDILGRNKEKSKCPMICGGDWSSITRNSQRYHDCCDGYQSTLKDMKFSAFGFCAPHRSGIMLFGRRNRMARRMAGACPLCPHF